MLKEEKKKSQFFSLLKQLKEGAFACTHPHGHHIMRLQ